MKKLDVFVVVFLAALAVVAMKARKLPADGTGFFTTAAAATAETKPQEIAPFGVVIGTPFVTAAPLIQALWPVTQCEDAKADVRYCFSLAQLDAVPVTIDWRFKKGVLQSVIVITDVTYFGEVYKALNNLYGPPTDHREMEGRNLYRWNRPDVTVGLDSAYPNEAEVFTIFFVILNDKPPKRDPAVVDF